MPRINSRKHHDKVTRNHRSAHHMNGEICDPMGIAFSCGDLILNMTDGERTWSVIFSSEETEALAVRFAERAAKVAA
jgi:hypothetical protein